MLTWWVTNTRVPPRWRLTISRTARICAGSWLRSRKTELSCDQTSTEPKARRAVSTQRHQGLERTPSTAMRRAVKARVEAFARLGCQARLSARQRVEPRPAVAGPDHPRQDVLRHAGDGFEAAPAVGQLHAAARRDASRIRVRRVYPQLRMRLGSR